MRIPRIYQPILLQIDQLVLLDQNASHHVVHVLRLPVGASLVVFNGHGGEYVAELVAFDKRIATVKIKQFHDNKVESPLEIHLGQGISRGDRMDYTLQKAVELGVTTVTPLITERCEVRLFPDRLQKRIQHWQGIVTAACEQSGRTKHVMVTAPQSLSDWVMKRCQSALCFVLHHRAKEGLRDFKIKHKNILLLIGPEGGLSETEIDFAKAQGFYALQLGPRVLRTETAALVAITALQYRWGDIGGFC